METKPPAEFGPEKWVESENMFPVVGIGASAGGLDAFIKLVQTIEIDSGMAYVLVQHLDPTHDSLLPTILQKVARIPVLEITDDIKVEPNHVYVIPSNKILIATDGVLQLAPRVQKNKNKQSLLPIDLFFGSLAEVHQSHAIGVVLSGTGSDGTLGLKSIKDQGGITLVQDEESAAYGSMPNSAVQAGVVDFILRPDEIPAKLVELTQITHGVQRDEAQTSKLGDDEAFRQINAVLRIRKGTDFTYYKQTTIRRRVLRRIAISKTQTPADYLKYLREHKAEQDILYQDLLIQVTTFFRDYKSFDNLREIIFPLIWQNKAGRETEAIRIWVAGCSSGEEAYSMAICFKEFLQDHSLSSATTRVQIFATDLSIPAIEKARAGVYTKMELVGISPARLQEYFTKSNGSYQISREIRDTCVFANHNFLKDPPFGKMDLISCRNVLIYMEPYLQKKALTTFHYALNAKGFLMLGKSETTSGVPDLFAHTIKNDKIYTRKDVPSRFMRVVSQRDEQDLSYTHDRPKSEEMHADFQKMADNIMLSRYTPPGVVVNEAMDIVQFRGSTSDYLEQSSGKPSHNLMVMAKQGLAFELRSILHKVKKDKTPIKKANIPVEVNGRLRSISIEAIPLPNTLEQHYLILFHDNPATASVPVAPLDEEVKKVKNNSKDLRIRQLEQELVQMREDMRIITEDQEAANEELQSANEELLSGSEELQSLNEELETSKEELQSINEELVVINHEMVGLNEQIAAAKNYAESIVANIREPLLVLDQSLRIKTANDAFYRVFKVEEFETEGALIYDLGNKQWDIPELRTLLENILPEKSIFNDFEVTHSFPHIGRLVMLLNAREVLNKNSLEKLILLSIEDITEQKMRQQREDDLRNKNLALQEENTKELEEKIQQRTIELRDANKELKIKNEDLLNMNKELEAFNYVSSHDMQEPLRKIQIFADRVLEKESANLSEKGKTYFNLMQDAASRMQTLISDLLAFSRLATLDKAFEMTDLQLILDEVKAAFKEVIEEKQIRIEANKLCSASIIPFQFRQLMHNLVGNAIKFSSPERPLHLIIRAEIVDGKKLKVKNILADKSYCHISISDNGIGFENEFAEKIFEVFQKLHDKDEYPGTGIGLAIVKKIVDNHNGLIIAKSKLNKGATFDIYIPCV